LGFSLGILSVYKTVSDGIDVKISSGAGMIVALAREFREFTICRST